MRVLILANNDMGLYKFRKELLEELVKKHKVYFCVPEGEFVEDICKIGCKFIECLDMDRHGTNPVKELKLMSFYLKVIKKIKPDIVFTYTIKCNAYGGMACALAKVPYVANITGLGTAIENGGILSKVSSMLYKIGLAKAQKVFFQNEENKEFMLSHGIVKGAYDVLPGSGVNVDKFKVYPYPDDGIENFIFVARVMKEKGIDQYLNAAKIITKKYPNTRFHVCGYCEQDYEEKLKTLQDKGTIIYHGLVNDMAPIYEMSSCTVHPTYYPEGLSNVLLESAASGRPIITTDRSGCREVVEDGVNGYVVKQKSSKDLIDKLEKFLNLSIKVKEKMGLAGRTKVEKEFDRKLVVAKYLIEVESKNEKK